MKKFQFMKLMAAAVASSLAVACSDEPKRPTDQENFVKTLNEYSGRYGSANALARENMRAERSRALCAAVRTSDVHNWVGRITRVRRNSDGRVEIVVELSPKVSLQTTNLHNESINSHVRSDSSLIPAISNLKERDVVVFSGRLYRSDPDCFKELSITESGSMRDPEMMFCFASISPAASPRLTRPSQSDAANSSNCPTQVAFNEAVERVRVAAREEQERREAASRLSRMRQALGWDRDCRAGPQVSCLSQDEAASLCGQIQSFSPEALRTFSILHDFDPGVSALLSRGAYRNVRPFWHAERNQCTVLVSVDGIFQERRIIRDAVAVVKTSYATMVTEVGPVRRGY